MLALEYNLTAERATVCPRCDVGFDGLMRIRVFLTTARGHDIVWRLTGILFALADAAQLTGKAAHRATAVSNDWRRAR